MNVLTLNTDLPIFPGGGGVEFLTMTRLAGLASHVGVVSMVHSRRDLERSRGLTDAGVELYLWESPWLDSIPQPPARTAARAIHGWVRRCSDAARGNWRSPSDTRVMPSAFSNMAPSLIQALSRRPWQVLAVVQSSAAAMIDWVPRPLITVLVMHDIRSRLYERRAAIAGSRVSRRRLAREARRYYEFERDYCQRFDLVTTVSENDARWVREHYAPKRVVHVPLPVDAAHFAPQSPALERAGRIAFTGMMNHPPNVDAACSFATDVFPSIRQRQPAAEFHVIGRNPVDAVLALGRLPGVTVFSDVPDVRTHLAEASVVVVPLRYGSGARQKILEAWSMEKCVVSSTIGAEGLEYEHDGNLIIADGPAAQAEAVTSALARPEVRNRVRSAGRAAALLFHDPARVAARYFDALTKVTEEKSSLDAPMHVLLDMRWMTPGLAGGIEQLARAFVREVRALDDFNQYTALVPASARYDLDGLRRSNFRTVSLDSVSALAGAAGARWRRRLLGRLRLADWRTPDVDDLRWLRSLGVEIAYSFPGYIHPHLRALRNVLVMPDIQHEYLPEFFSSQALAERRRLYTESAQRADHICAISEFTRQTLIHTLGLPPDKITTVRLAADALFTPKEEQVVDDHDARVLASHQLESAAYVFFPAHTWHHKNHRAAIEALRILRDRSGTRPTLVCTGGPREAQPAIDQQIAAAGLDGQIRFLGYRPRRELLSLYRGAGCLLFPSLFEGFGMPVLEAMASGCPVVCSDATSLPEIAGDAALLVNPTDSEAIATAVQRVLGDRELRRDLTNRGLARARIFSWRRHTLETIAVLRRVHDQIRHP